MKLIARKIAIAVVSALAALASLQLARAASTIDTTVPAFGVDFDAAPIRNNFVAAASDINKLQSRTAGSSQPAGLATFQDWANTSGCPTACALTIFDGTVPVQWGTLNQTAHNFSLTFAAPQKFNLNAAALPTALAGTVIQIGNADSTATRLELDAFGAQSFFTSAAYGGTAASPTAVTSGQIGGYNAHAYNGASLVGPISTFRIFAAENIASGHQGSYAEVCTTAIATTSLACVMRWENDGGVTVPSSVTGGDKGIGSINANLLYKAGALVLASGDSAGGDLTGTYPNPTVANLTTATGLPISTGVAGLGTGVATALGINVGSAGAVVTNGGALGTPSSGVLTNATNLPAAGQQQASTTAGGPARLRYQATAVNFNSGNTDTTFTLNLPPGVTRYIVSTVRISHASGTLTTSTFGLFTAAAGGGVAIMTGTANTISSASENTNNNAMGTAPATGATQSYNASQLFFRVQTAQGTAATADVHIEIILMP